ncbi:MAG: hypothetical protein JRI68_19410 [Deltaproteobacteria bacterium]|nr:hypothetical protein [Deltaproteobacteria bacterium]
MRRTLISLPLMALTACAGAPAPDTTALPATTATPAAPTATATTAPTASAEPTAAASATPPEPKVELLDIPAKCKEACERNGAKCDTINVPGCIKGCSKNLEPAQPLCPKRMRAFFDCVDADELRCKEGSKIRTVGCKDEAWGLASCVLNAKKKPEERCKVECDYEGYCQLEEGECIAVSQADCDKSTECKEKLEGQICELRDKKCVIKNPPAAE